MESKMTKPFTPHVKTEISKIQHIKTQRDFRVLSTAAEKVHFLQKLGFGRTAIAHATNLNVNNVKRYLRNHQATSVRGKSYLNSEEEELLVSIILTREKDHTSVDRSEIANSAWEIAVKREIQLRPRDKPSYSWVSKFIHRHEELKEIASQKVETKRTEACSRVAIEKFFRDVVGPMMEKHQFKPQNTWNFDETMLGYRNRRRRVVVSRSSKSAKHLSQTRSQTTQQWAFASVRVERC